jgi:hypothetical protein
VIKYFLEQNIKMGAKQGGAKIYGVRACVCVRACSSCSHRGLYSWFADCLYNKNRVYYRQGADFGVGALERVCRKLVTRGWPNHFAWTLNPLFRRPSRAELQMCRARRACGLNIVIFLAVLRCVSYRPSPSETKFGDETILIDAFHRRIVRVCETKLD